MDRKAPLTNLLHIEHPLFADYNQVVKEAYNFASIEERDAIHSQFSHTTVPAASRTVIIFEKFKKLVNL